MTKNISKLMLLFVMLITTYSAAQSEQLILSEQLLSNSKVFIVEELPQKRNFFNTKISKFKFGEYVLTEGSHNWGSSTSQKQTKNGNQVINRSKFKFTISNNENIASSVKVVKESKELIFDNGTFLEQLVPAIGSTIPSVENQTEVLTGTLSNPISNADWQFIVKKIINKEHGNTFEMFITKGDRRITIQVASINGEQGLIRSGFEFFENNQSLAALFIGLPNKTIWFKNNLDSETEIILATMMVCLMVEYPKPSAFIYSY